MTLYPCGQPGALFDSLSYTAFYASAKGAIARIGTSGQVCATANSSTGSAHVIIDASGYLP